VVRQRPDLADASIGEPMDGMTLLFGYVCGGGAVVAEPAAPDALFEDPRTPSGRPGSRVPHVALRGPDDPVSPRELIGPHWLVLTGSADGVQAAQVAAGELGVSVRAYRVGEDLHDTDGAWARLSGAGPEGTVLVRPDGVVAWRGGDATGLAKALRTVLHR
jgi:putative polyketide hydroxylase